jgi:DNA-binding NtrC family response regulator
MSSLWIVHRSSRQRAALMRLACATEDAVIGAPGDPVFDAAPAPDVILLGLDDDWEAELEFASNERERAAGARWLLCGEPASREPALRLFDNVRAEFLAYPPDPELLRARIRNGAAAALPPPLSQRTRRQAVALRFARWFVDLEMPDLLRALDPRLADVPLLIRGEPGTGRGVLARYVHLFGGTSAGRLVHLPCGASTSAEEILQALAAASELEAAGTALAIWLEDVEQLRPVVQRRIAEWIESGVVPAAVRSPILRWIGTAGDVGSVPELEPGLRRALSSLAVHLPPLRERPHLVEAVASEVARSWCTARGERPRRFGEDSLAVMEEYPWPGNLQELEAVVVQSLAFATSDPIRSGDLRYDGRDFAPLVAPAEVDDAPRGAKGAEAASTETAPEAARQPAPPGAAAAGADEGRDSALQSEPPGSSLAENQGLPATGAPLGRLVSALSHEVRNPLATIRTFAGLLPERFDDPAFRSQFAEMVSHDVGRIDALIERLNELSTLGTPSREKVDVTALLEGLLREREDTIRARRLLVLKELDANRPYALGDRAQLRFAFDALLGKSFELVPERGDLYIASRQHAARTSGSRTVRVLIRFHSPEGSGAAAASGVSLAEHSLEIVVAELVIRAQGGSLAIATTEGEETVILTDLPAS